MRSGLHRLGWRIVAAWLGVSGFASAAERVAPLRVEADSLYGPGYPAGKAFDGVVSDDSRWISDAALEAHWIAAELDGEQALRAADVYSGWEDQSMIENFVLQQWVGNGWQDIPGTSVKKNRKQGVRLIFPKPVSAGRVRLFIPEAGGNGQARLRELVLWKQGVDELPPMEKDLKKGAGSMPRNPVFPEGRHLVFLNQSGFNLDWPKRFTAPRSEDGTAFVVTPQSYPQVMFRGTIEGGVGDFSDFRPVDPDMQYVVRVQGGALKEGVSDPFFVAPFWMQRVSLDPALRHFVDDRSIVGTHPGAFGAAPWRDSPFYAYSTASLVHLFLSHPSYFKQQRVEMDWERDIQRALLPGFPYDSGAGEKSMELLARMHEEIDPPVGEQVPDIIQLIHWGVSWWLLKPESKDYAGTGYKLHPETITIFSFYLYAHPWMKEYFTDAFHQRVSDYTFSMWEKAGLLDVQKRIGTFKGRYAPGWTILPNLMMHEVAKREGREDAGRFLDAAVAQAEWIVQDVDFDLPLNTKGQRMAEHKTMSGLSILLREYPDRAPEGLREKIREWTRIAARRSDNLWDYRRYDEGKNWSLPRSMPGHTGGGSSWNDPGNLACLPGMIWQASEVLDESGGNDRLHQIAVAQWDILFGRNPIGCHSAWRGPMDFVGVERGWPVKYRPVCAYLHKVRGSLCSSPATEHFPFNPAGQFRHPEGWTAFNAAWNVALAESVRREVSFSREGKRLSVRGPFFVPVVEVTVTDGNGGEQVIPLVAKDFRQHEFSGTLPGTAREVSYGHGFFKVSSRTGTEN